MTPDELTDRDRALWAVVARTVTPLAGVAASPAEPPATPPPAPRPLPPPAPPAPSRPGPAQLDGSWERRLARGQVDPDRTIDLHGLRLDAAWDRLDEAMAGLAAGGGRVLLVIAGRDRGPDVRGRPGARGRIRANLPDWLHAGAQASRILAVRPAHSRHGGAGAVYVVLKRARRRDVNHEH